jgi:hypothetical protein
VGKRANGEGSIYERKDGRWVASITLENGKRKSVYGATKQEAVQAKQKLLNSEDHTRLDQEASARFTYMRIGWVFVN